jgi:hypothetical protein
MKRLTPLLAIIGMLVFANAPASTKDFALHQAVLDDDKQLVKQLLNKGAAIDVIGSRKYGYGSALHLAVREGHLDIAKLLLDRGAQVDVLDPDDLTPLHNAAWNGNLEMTKLLLAAGADINASTYDGDTPLKLAQNNDQTQVAEFIQANLQPSATSEVKVESVATNDTGVIDISGTYTSEITHKDTYGYAQQLPRHYFGKNSNIVVNIKQNGNIITGTMSGHSTGVIEGVIKGNEIIFDWEMKPRRSGGVKFGKGIWVVSGDQVTLNGTWKSGSSASIAQPNGIWNLTKIESDAAPIPDISGTYIAIYFYYI